MKKVIVCGVRFGQFYLEALKYVKDAELAGILSTGSDHSLKTAELYGTKVYTSVDDIPDDIDLALVVIRTGTQGGRGTETALKLMGKGISVLLEQPVHKKELMDLYKTAAKHKVYFNVGNHYSVLRSVNTFISYAKAFCEKQRPIYININMATQLSYPCCQVLAEIFSGKHRLEEKGKILGDMPFKSVSLELDHIPVNIIAQNEMAGDVSDNYTHLFFSINIGFPSGTLTLHDVHGGVSYRERMTIPRLDHIPYDLKELRCGQMCEESIRELVPVPSPSYKTILTEWWPRAIAKNIEEICQVIDGEYPLKKWNQKSMMMLEAADLWTGISEMFGYPTLNEDPKRQWQDLDEVEDLRYKELSLTERFELTDKVSVDRCTAQLNEACLAAMLCALQRNGVLTQKRAYTEDEILTNTEHLKKYEYIIKRWLNVLKKEGKLDTVPEGYIPTERPYSEEEFELLWKKAGWLWTDRCGTKPVFDYFYDNAKSLERLLKGEVSAQEMLFSEGKTDIAGELYRKTLIAWTMNRHIADVIRAEAQEKGRISVLEIGAGTGATTNVVLGDEEIVSRTDEYMFTDLSRYFLDDAKKTYSGIDGFKTKVVDIESDSDLKDIGIYDIILGAGVLNNVKDTGKVMSDLRKCLKDDGRLIISEAVGESLPMLISQVFMMEAADDDRKDTDSTFLSMEQWQRIFDQAGFVSNGIYPGDDHRCASLGQKVFVLSKITDRKE